MAEFIISIIILVFGFAIGAMTYGQSPSIERERQLASVKLREERDEFKNLLISERQNNKKLELENLKLKEQISLLNQLFS
jgi:hypothetical protein